MCSVAQCVCACLDTGGDWTSGRGVVVARALLPGPGWSGGTSVPTRSRAETRRGVAGEDPLNRVRVRESTNSCEIVFEKPYFGRATGIVKTPIRSRRVCGKRLQRRLPLEEASLKGLL